MTGIVHAIVGACAGSFFKRRSSAFVAGVATHWIADTLPHEDLDPKIEVPLLGAALLALAKWKGVDSPEFCGAVGGFSPDIEHGLEIVGIIEPEHKVFPTHIDDGCYHGRNSNERVSQILIACAAIAIIALNASTSRSASDG